MFELSNDHRKCCVIFSILLGNVLYVVCTKIRMSCNYHAIGTPDCAGRSFFLKIKLMIYN